FRYESEMKAERQNCYCRRLGSAWATGVSNNSGERIFGDGDPAIFRIRLKNRTGKRSCLDRGTLSCTSIHLRTKQSGEFVNRIVGLVRLGFDSGPVLQPLENIVVQHHPPGWFGGLRRGVRARRPEYFGVRR